MDEELEGSEGKSEGESKLMGKDAPALLKVKVGAVVEV